MGRLNYASTFVPDFKWRVRPIEALLRRDGGDWQREHTDALNEIAELVYQRIRLGLVDFQQPARIHVDADASDGSAVMT